MSKEIEKVSSPKQVFEHVKLDYTNISVGAHDNINFGFKFQVMPFDYLSYAQKDMSEISPKGLINALSNAKRSIDCLIEVVLRSLSIDPNNIEKSALDFCAHVLSEKEQDIKPMSLRLFCALGFAPSFMISEVRNLRNKVEHEFHIPEEFEVVRALEVSELLINNVKAKEIFSSTIDISDVKRFEKAGEGYITGVYFEQDYKTGGFKLSGTGKCGLEVEYEFNANETEYFYLLRAMFVADHDREKLVTTIYKLLDVLDIATPSEFRKVRSVHR
ncbi:TPA: hypothetical protein RSW61_005479 [Vibrio harveyi]|nr:hypothetical protein [Vibrio harveyi]